MKKHCLLFLATFCAALSTHAQDTVTPGGTPGFQSFFGRESTEWDGVIVDYDFYWGGLLRASIDTVIDGMQYKKLEYSEAEWWYEGAYYERRYSEYDFYLREDTSTGRLWCRFPDMFPDRHPWTGEELSREALIVDMTLSIGDTFAPYNPSLLYDIAPYTVVDTMTVDHRRIIVLRRDYYPEEIKFIEGVGTTALFINAMLDESASYVTCCHKDGELVYHWQSQENDSTCAPQLYVGIENREDQTTISVYPNPCTDKVWIDGENVQSATLLDIKGNVQKNAIDPRQPLDMSPLPKGVYLLRLIINNSVVSKTIIKM